MKQKFIFLIGILLAYFFILDTTFAASIPRNDLRLELLLETGALDTSGLGRTVISTGGAPQYKIDPITGISYAQFGGTGGLTATTGWNGLNTDDFTLSFWVKVRPQDMPGSGSTYYFNPYVAPYGYVTSSTAYYLPTLFSSHTSPTVNAFSIRLRKDYQCAIGGIKNGTTGASYYHDSINNPTLWINCSKLNDSKWHLMVAKRYGNLFTLQIDNDSVYSSTGSTISSMYIGRTFSLGYFPLKADTGALIYQMGENHNTTNATSYFTGSMTKFRFYSRALSAIEISALQDENIISQSELSGTGNLSVILGGYNSPNLQLTLSGVPLSLSKTGVTYQFSINSGTYTNIQTGSITDISTSTGSYKYSLVLDMSIYSDGVTNIILRTKSGASTYQTIGSVKFTKLDLPYGIDITEPATSLSLSKTQTAAIIGTGGILTMVLTRGNICDSTLTYEPYSDMIFTSKQDNFIRICYKAVYSGINKTIYKLSNPIQGITGASNTATGVSIFQDYVNWTKSSYIKYNDTTSAVLDLLAVSASASNGTINGVTITDINGDGLVDFLYSRNDPVRKAIIVNNGNFTFRTVYKCAVDVSPIWYYGDCADTTR